MTQKTILIDAAHREETRVAVLEDGILQDFDREAIAIKQIKGNIYLAKVVRVEQSLQAAFVDYDGNRHGFLPFPEIHPDYYQISDTDKQKLRELAQNNKKNEDEDSNNQEELSEKQLDKPRRQNYSHQNNNIESDEDEESITTGSYSVEDETEVYGGNIYGVHKRYNIQDVIKPGQLVLVQVAKEERGSKGAAMTTFISIAGKYCVLMPNTPNKGGVSKKVDNFRDRKILKSILGELSIPLDRSVIIRTAGVGKRPEEIKRDYEYLSRLWGSIFEASSNSKAPSFIHAEDDIIKKIIRDIYNESIKEVVVEGRKSHQEVVDFIRLTMPNINHNIQLHEERVPIFNKYKVEQQISALYEKQIFLPSGGSIVIDNTEALVAIDVNSGRATKESGIEETAYKTNLEAVKEIARQLKLRDLAGLVVIDFIDMYDQRHRRNVERLLRDELQNDRARIQLGRISVFGLLEMSRQRLGSSFFETITQPCKNCNGTGYVRSVEILAVSIFRAIRHSSIDNQVGVVYIYTSNEIISYMMNYKRQEILNTENSYKIHIFFHFSDNIGSAGFEIKRRKGLSEEEKREIEMEVSTGKVNMLKIEQQFNADGDNFSNHRNNNSEENREENNNRRSNKKNHKYKNLEKKRGNHNNSKSSIIGTIFDFLKKAKNR